MDLITATTLAVPTLAAISFGRLWWNERREHKATERRVGIVHDLYTAGREKIEKLECQAASDGNRLSQLRRENADLTRQRDKVIEHANVLNDEIQRLQPLADKALAAQAQRVRASQAAKAKRDARRAQAA